MSFNLAMFQPESLAKADNGATGIAPGDLGQPSYDGPRALPAGQWHPDPSVTDRRGGPVPGAPVSVATLRGRTGTAPGEPVNEIAVPAIVKAGTSGTPTPLASNRYASRPGQGRHPVSGQYTSGEDIAAGHPSLDQQPADRDARRFTPATTDLASRACADSTIRQHLAGHMASAAVQSMDLRGPSGMPQFAQPVQSPQQAGSVGHHLGTRPHAVTPDTGAAAMPVPLIGQRQEHPADAVPSFPQANSPAFRGGFLPQPAFGGMLPSQVTGTAPGW